jgi:hypothetical protein
MMIAPWALRNEIVLGRPVLGSTLTGYNIYRHNYQLDTDDYLRYVGPDEGKRAVEMLIARRTDLTGLENEAQMDAIYREEGLKIIWAHPGKYLLLSMFRFFPLWFNWDIGKVYGAPPGFLDYSIIFIQLSLLFLAIYGTRGRIWDSLPFWVCIIATCAAYMLIDSQLRYLIQIMPLVITLSAKGFINLIEISPDKNCQAGKI